MKQFFITYQNEICTTVISIVVSIITTLLTHFLGKNTLRYKEKIKIASKLSETKYEGIKEIREKVRILIEYEDLSVTEDSDLILPDNKGKIIQSPACCYSFERLSQLSFDINDLYGEYGHCLRHTAVIYLIHLNNFIFEYVKKCKKAELTDEDLRVISQPLYNGLNKWYKRIDKELINSLNKPSMKYYSHSGVRYQLLLWIYGVYFRKTEPYKYILGDKNIFNKLEEYNNEIIDEL